MCLPFFVDNNNILDVFPVCVFVLFVRDSALVILRQPSIFLAVQQWPWGSNFGFHLAVSHISGPWVLEGDGTSRVWLEKDIFCVFFLQKMFYSQGLLCKYIYIYMPSFFSGGRGLNITGLGLI